MEANTAQFSVDSDNQEERIAARRTRIAQRLEEAQKYASIALFLTPKSVDQVVKKEDPVISALQPVAVRASTCKTVPY